MRRFFPFSCAIAVLALWTILSVVESCPAQQPQNPAEITNSIGMKLMFIPAGKYLMGSPATEKERKPDEGPQHEVTISQPFYMGAYEVTQEEYVKVMSVNPSHFAASGTGQKMVQGIDTKRFPVESVTWHKAMEFCKKLSALPEEKKAGRVYTLPTEAQWEYACRGNSPSYQVFHYGNSLSSRQANFNGEFPYNRGAKGPNWKRTAPVGTYPKNAFGLYDLHGNVWEWCLDWYEADHYSVSEKQDPKGPSPTTGRVFRGGCWSFRGRGCRSAIRARNDPTYWDCNVGFRVVMISGK